VVDGAGGGGPAWVWLLPLLLPLCVGK